MHWIGLALAFLVISPIAGAKVIGRMTPAEPLTEARIAALPAGERAPWLAYLRRSHAAMAADKVALAAERRGLTEIPSGPSVGTPASMPLDRAATWYAGAEAARVAENIVSFQTPAGGWSKNHDRTAAPRRRGQSWVVGQDPRIARLPGAAEPGWTYVGTIDNGATHGELRFLARVQGQRAGADGDRYRASFVKGLRYLLAAQFPNGGWPQIYPLQGGYHDAITFNDGGMPQVAMLLAEVGARDEPYRFVPADLAAAAGAAARRATALVLRTQVTIDGKRTIWGQQHDPLTLVPVGARNFEPAALSTDESVDLVVYLRRYGGEAGAAAARDATAWLKAKALRDVAWGPAADAAQGRMLVGKPGAGPLWPRYFSIAEGVPIFGDRDRAIHDDVNQITLERRNGYSWFNTRPCRLLEPCG